ncbi:aminotransferase class III-fold pyridoxal phosphate-dependent enzyme [uncultured Maribacter sp.]|uniref:aminotransferase class III-fold pyridoxal phosphate-dependent enzyme n=1 Tax=uncultured Maribacter sp. TaxID=431308 RepID=UPI0030D99517|tara:strand:- start:1361 stop:3649 length:2289 start_codon:yes stop_codon:yes gene_type:complete
MDEKLQLVSILNMHFNINKPLITKLEGYDSTNFKIEVKGEIFVLKVYENTAEILELITAENKTLLALKKKDVHCSEIIANNTGDYNLINGNYIYRLLTFVSGTFLAETKHTTTLMKSFGRTLADIDHSLYNLSNTAIKAKQTQWDLQHFHKNWKYLADIPDASDRSLVDYFCLQFNEHILPLHYEFRQSIIHNDANDWNVLVHNDSITGIIDFGDMCYSWLINELAVALTYVLMDKENPLEIAKHIIKAYHIKLPLQENEVDALYYLIAARLCTSVLNSAHTKKIKPESSYITISEKSAWSLLRKWITINPIKAKNTFRSACDFSKLPSKNLEAQLVRRNNNISQAQSLSYKEPIQMSGAAFQYMYDTEGNTFLDAYNNIIQVGHCHPKVVRAGQRTMAKLNTNTRYIYEELLSYTDKLLSKFPAHLNKVFLVNSGSAASDLALRIAKTHTKKNKVMVLQHGYHGNTQNAIDISHYKYNHSGGTGRKDDVIETEMPKIFGASLASEKEITEHYIALANERIQNNNGNIAAFIAEPIIGCGGQVPLPKTYLKNIYPEIRKQGGLCISDEVQVGFGRLGEYFWGYEMYDVIPDIIILGKPIGNGHPMAAVVTTEEISNSFNNGMEFFSSFGGNPVSCAIGQAVLDVLEEEELPKKAQLVGQYLKQELKTLQTQHKELADIRGEGLFLGVEVLDSDGNAGTDLAAIIKNELRSKFILISTDGPYDNVLKIKPPLYFNKENANQLVNEIDEILKKIKKINTFKVNK